ACSTINKTLLRFETEEMTRIRDDYSIGRTNQCWLLGYGVLIVMHIRTTDARTPRRVHVGFFTDQADTAYTKPESAVRCSASRVEGGVLFVTHGRSLPDHRPWHHYKAGTEHMGFSPTTRATI
ncbi:unnamed protein product, partial [Laminaria digitata]